MASFENDKNNTLKQNRSGISGIERRNKLDDQQTVFLFQNIVAHFFKLIRGERSIFFKNLPITPAQYDVLQCLYKKSLSLAQLSDELLLDSSTLVGIVVKLESKELIKKKVNPHDRRKNILTITDKGKIMFDRIPAFTSKTIERMFELMKTSEKTEINKSLKKIVKILEQTHGVSDLYASNADYLKKKDRLNPAMS
jgi:DNA-binding MarR family transcriptional regulator